MAPNAQTYTATPNFLTNPHPGLVITVFDIGGDRWFGMVALADGSANGSFIINSAKVPAETQAIDYAFGALASKE